MAEAPPPMTRDAASQTFIQDEPSSKEDKDRDTEPERSLLPVIAGKCLPSSPRQPRTNENGSGGSQEKTVTTLDLNEVIVPSVKPSTSSCDAPESCRKQPSEGNHVSMKLKLPEVHVLHVSFSQDLTGTTPRHSSRYVDRYKATMKLKGLKMQDIFSLDRTGKATEKGKKKKDRSPKRSTAALPFIMDFPSKDQDLGNDISKDSEHTARQGKGQNIMDKQTYRHKTTLQKVAKQPTEIELERRLNKVVDGYRGTPGIQRIRRGMPCRKLGSIVSAERMTQLLQTTDPLKMEDCYNYYP